MKYYILLYSFICIFILCCEDKMYISSADDEKQQYAGIEIVLPTQYLYTNQTIQAQVVILLNSGSRITAGDTVITWDTGDSNILYVSSEGNIEARGEGKASVIASAAGFSVSEELNAADYSKVLLNTIYYDPPGNDDRSEYIEVFNYNISPCSLSGFSLAGGDGKPVFTFPQGSIVQDNSGVIAASSFEGFYEEFGYVPEYCTFMDPLNNNGETVSLLMPDGNIRDCVYIEGGSADYPADADWGSPDLPSCAEGESVSRTGPLDSSSYSDWAPASPGQGDRVLNQFIERVQ